MVKQVRRWDKDCYCNDEQLCTKLNSCSNCHICRQHYKCSCENAEKILCRHVHVVSCLGRKRANRKDYAKKAQHVKDLLSWSVEKKDRFQVNTVTCTPEEYVNNFIGAHPLNTDNEHRKAGLIYKSFKRK